MRSNYSGIGRRGPRACRPNNSGIRRKSDLDVYRDCAPPIAYKELALLTNDGRVFEQSEIEEIFLRRAREIGGDALVLFPPVKSIDAPRGWKLYDTFLYEAVVVVYGD
jgi:hypothetical protein